MRLLEVALLLPKRLDGEDAASDVKAQYHGVAVADISRTVMSLNPSFKSSSTSNDAPPPTFMRAQSLPTPANAMSLREIAGWD